MVREINKSSIDPEEKRNLFREIIFTLSKDKSISNVDSLKKKIGKLIGSNAINYFIQLAAAVSAGLILRNS